MLAGLLVVGHGSVQEPAYFQCIPRSLVDVLKTIRAEVDATVIPSDYDEDVVDVLGGDECVDPETS